MKRLWGILGMAVICCSCEKEAADGPEDRKVDVRVAWDAATKISVGESCVVGDTADIFVYDDDEIRRLDTYQRRVLGDGGIDVAATAGPKIVAMTVNGRTGRYSWTASNTYSYMESLDAELEKETRDHPTMSGSCRTEGGYGCEIDLVPLMAKVTLRSIRCDFTGRGYEGEPFTDAKVYLTNVSSLCRMMDDGDSSLRGTLNTGMLREEDIGRMADPSLLVQELPESIGKDFVEVDRELFCYPNISSEDRFGTPFTRMVIEGKIEGRTWYYPINVNREDICWVEGTPGVERGRNYVYDVTIKRTGSLDPDVPVSVVEASVICEVLPWEEKEERDEEY